MYDVLKVNVQKTLVYMYCGLGIGGKTLDCSRGRNDSSATGSRLSIRWHLGFFISGFVQKTKTRFGFKTWKGFPMIVWRMTYDAPIVAMSASLPSHKTMMLYLILSAIARSAWKSRTRWKRIKAHTKIRPTDRSEKHCIFKADKRSAHAGLFPNFLGYYNPGSLETVIFLSVPV